MTGFAAARSDTSAGELSVSLRSVNHRGLDLHFHGSHEFSAFENEMRGLLKRNLARGHVEVRFTLNRAEAGSLVSLNREALHAYVLALRQAASDLDLEYEPDLNVLLTLRGVMGGEAPVTAGLPPGFLAELLACLEVCAWTLNIHREREGDQLRVEMIRQTEEVERWTDEIFEIRRHALPHFHSRLRDKLAELLGTSGLSEGRIAEEAALLADRSDIQEEIVRLRVHIGELKKTLASGGEVGKRVDFLLQELNRETNTALAKSATVGEPGLRITTLGLAVKANIERIREQALNLE